MKIDQFWWLLGFGAIVAFGLWYGEAVWSGAEMVDGQLAAMHARISAIDPDYPKILMVPSKNVLGTIIATSAFWIGLFGIGVVVAWAFRKRWLSSVDAAARSLMQQGP